MSAKIAAARPLLLYYCFMNLAKAFIIQRKKCSSLPNAAHGLKERLRGVKELDDAFLKAEKTTGSKISVFDALLNSVTNTGLPHDTDYDVIKLLPQVVPGHRLWAEASEQEERFVCLHDVRVMENKRTKKLWLNLYLFEDDLTRIGATHKRALEESRLKGRFSEVNTTRIVGNRKLICFQQITCRTYVHRPSDEVHKLADDVRDLLWVTVASVPKYRRYYIYLSPSAEHASILPQLLSIYALTFYLGSITRYRPHHFDKIVDGEYGLRIEEFISGQPLQFIYLMASEFAKREVTQPSIV